MTVKISVEESFQTLEALREAWASDHGHALHEARAEALRIVLELARKTIAPPVECSHGRGQTHRGWCSRCNQWACLACGAIVPAGKGPRCVDCREAA